MGEPEDLVGHPELGALLVPLLARNGGGARTWRMSVTAVGGFTVVFVVYLFLRLHIHRRPGFPLMPRVDPLLPSPAEDATGPGRPKGRFIRAFQGIRGRAPPPPRWSASATTLPRWTCGNAWPSTGTKPLRPWMNPG